MGSGPSGGGDRGQAELRERPTVETTTSDDARQAATVRLSFTGGLEDDLRDADADAVRRELATGMQMVTRGAFARSASTSARPHAVTASTATAAATPTRRPRPSSATGSAPTE
ncbi:hypothetical protein [Streptomyces sp. NPDC056061]|uniref:hypothetical protein n=1 Tax=Streptomyces sp. NPDC056061 TaxID=3345700 RepID=UPI0035D6D103